jgi:hypothetical protein
MNPDPLRTPIALHVQSSFQRPRTNILFPAEEETVNNSSLGLVLDAGQVVQAPVYATNPLSIPPPITTALDTANALLYESISSTADFKFKHTLISQALAIGRYLSSEIVNPLSVIRPHDEDIQNTKQLLLYSHAAMIQILCHHNYIAHRELIHENLKQIVRLLGHRMLYDHDPKVMIVFPTIIAALKSLNWTIPQRMAEWIRVASTVPLDDYFVANRFYSHLSVMRMEMDNTEEALKEGKLDEIKDTITIMQYPVDVVIRCLEIISSVEGQKLLPTYREWRCPEHYRGIGEPMLARFYKVRRDVEGRILLRQGDALLELATDRVRAKDGDYFKFQAMLALDSYRSAYQACIAYEEVNIELEGLCLWSMGRVMGKYLNLDEHAHSLYFQAVSMVGMLTALLPTSEWYTDAVEQIQQYRKRLENEEIIARERERTQILEQFTLELFELHSRAERVYDENSLREFFRWLLWTHRPRQSCKIQANGELLEAGELSRVVLNVIGAYHVSEKDNCDNLWIVFSEEIVKVLPSLICVNCRLSIAFLGAQELFTSELHEFYYNMDLVNIRDRDRLRTRGVLLSSSCFNQIYTISIAVSIFRLKVAYRLEQNVKTNSCRKCGESLQETRFVICVI